MSGKNSRGGSLNRVLFTKTGMRKKVYKRLKNRLIEMGLSQDEAEVTVEALIQKQITINDEQIKEDVDFIIKSDKEIKRLTTKIENQNNSGPQGFGM